MTLLQKLQKETCTKTTRKRFRKARGANIYQKKKKRTNVHEN